MKPFDKTMYKIRKRINRLIGPPIIRALHIKIFGKNVFINRYTRRVPGLKNLIVRVDSLTIAAYTRKQLYKDYKRWFTKNFPSSTQLKEQTEDQKRFSSRPLISLLVPTYNTDHKYLKECMQSVIDQSYDNWQLCMADDASTDSEVRNIIKRFADSDKRISYVFREKNGHISSASNSALELARGDFVALLDHDDYLWPNALYEVVQLINEHPDADFIYSDEDKIEANGKQHCDPFFKPDWSPEFLRSINYITHFAVLRKQLVNKIGGFRMGYEGAQDWDLFLRASRETDSIYHVPTIIYSWRKSENSTAENPSAKEYAYINQKKALKDDIRSRKMGADLEWEIPYFMWRVSYKLKENPMVSIVIPTKDQPVYIERCLASIKRKTTYENYEIVLVDTGSTDDRVWEIYKKYKSLGTNFRVIKWDKPFNFAAVCDFGAARAKGKYLLFLNNDTEVITPEWLQFMLGYAQQKDIGAVGCKLYYPDKKLQHAGVILGVGGMNGTPGIAQHFFPAYIEHPPQSPLEAIYIGGARDFAAVTAACVMVSSQKFKAVGGFDPKFKIAFNDIDFCLKLLQKKWRNVYLPQVNLIHYESISVGQPGSTQRDLNVFKKEIDLMLKKWQPIIDADPYYHPEFRRDIANARIDI